MKKISYFKSNKGFTLVEMLGVIIILSFLSFLVSQVIINNIENNNNKLESLAIDVIISSAREYVELNPNEFPRLVGAYYYIEYEQLKNENLINDDMLPSFNKSNELKSKYVKVEYNGNNYIYTLVDERQD